MHFKSLLVLLVISSLLNGLNAGTICRALVLEGGGDKGAYQAGALSQMYAQIP